MRGILMVVGLALLAGACSDPIGPVPPGELAPGMPAVAVPAYTVGEQTDEGLRCRFRPVFNRDLHWIRGSVVVPSMGSQSWYEPEEMLANTHLTLAFVDRARTSFYVVWQFTYYIHDQQEYVDINGVFTCVAPPQEEPSNA